MPHPHNLSLSQRTHNSNPLKAKNGNPIPGSCGFLASHEQFTHILTGRKKGIALTQNRHCDTRAREKSELGENARLTRLNQGDGKDARILLERETWNPRRSTRERLERGSGAELTDRACGIAHNEISARNLSHLHSLLLASVSCY
jgi:hypothetical protein